MKNNRTFLEKLLDGAKIEWRTIDEVSNKVSSGGTPATSNNSYYENGNIPWLRTQEVDFKEIWDTDIKITEEGLNNSSAKWIPKNCVIVAMYGATVGKIAINKIPLTTNQACANIEVNPEIAHYRYVFHYLMSKYEYIKSLGSGSQTNINSQIVKKIRIPIPPLSVQTEIVKILDALTALTSELTSELILRRKQYEYYREKLLSEEELGKVGFKWKTLEELVENTQNIRWKNNTKTYRYIDLTSVDRENNNITGTTEINALNAPSRAQKIVKENDVIFATTRPTQQRVALISKEFSDEIASTGYCVLRAKTNIVLPKWLFYFLSTINFKNYVEENQSGSAYPAISDSKVKEFRIPVPEVTIQQSIIEKLDKFYSLTNSLLHGLPKEINNRTKQYSYYQKELLNFLGREIYE